jgi:hypothetical protein
LAVLALGLIGWIVTALVSNDRFSVAAGDSYQQIGTAMKAFEEARRSIASAVESRIPSRSRPTGSNSDAESKSKSDDMAEEIARRVENEGAINSISARGLLMERAFRSYQAGPFFGQGLAAAHALQPHNTFLLFAVAFGDLGWLVPIAFLGLTIYWARGIRQLPLSLATLTVLATSHDVLLTLGLLAPIVFGIAGLNSLRYRAHDAPDTSSAMKYSAVAAPILFALGGASIANIRTSSVTAAPKLLILLVFGAITLWSIAVWLWYEKSKHQPEMALQRGHEWD